MFSIIFLIFLAIIWMIFAVIQDLRYREIANWLNFSLVFFALGFRFFYSLFSENWAFFNQGIIGLIIFFILAHIFYYGRFFAGGDAKLLIALGVILPIHDVFFENLKVFAMFFILFFIVGAVYTISSSIYIGIKNSSRLKRKFKKIFKENKNTLVAIIFLGLMFIIFGMVEKSFLFLGILVLILPYIYIYIKSVDEACMVKKVSPSKLTEGDWLYNDVKIGKKTIKASWHGLDKDEIKILKKSKKQVWIRRGLAFSPVFLISFLILIYIIFYGNLENILSQFWNF